jgi:hypothetical protein
MSNHFLLRIGDGKHFNSSSSKSIWGVNSKNNSIPQFLSGVKPGDILWFVKSRSKCQIVAVATFKEAKNRILGPLLALSPTNEDLGWVNTEGSWDTEIHYTDLYNLTDCNMFSEIKSPLVIRLYNDKCKVNLLTEYPNIVRYSRVTKTM